MKKQKAKQLVRALRSGEYAQGRGSLVNDNDEFCCLGVVCNISKQPLEWELHDGLWHIGGRFGYLPEDIQREFGFHDPFGRRRDGNNMCINGSAFHSLVEANDCGCTFEQIADYIEKHWEML